MAEAQHIPQEDFPRIDPIVAPRDAARPWDRSSDWGSLVADLSTKNDRPEWQIHDRTHLEFALDYRVDPAVRTTAYEWEAFFFIPESLRLDGKTYDKQDIYSDLQSYVRFAVPDVAFGELAGEPVERIRNAAKRDVQDVMRELRSIRPSNVQSIEAGLYITDAKKRIADSVRAAGQDVTASLKTYDTAYNQLVANSNPKAFREFLLSAPRMFLDLGEKIGAISHIASFWRFRFPRDQAIRIDAEELIAVFQDFETSFGIVQSQTFAMAS